MVRKKRQMWVDDEFKKEVQAQAKQREISMLDYTKSIADNLKHEKTKRR